MTRLSSSDSSVADTIKEDVNQDLLIKDMVKPPSFDLHYSLDPGLVRPFRKVSFKEAHQQSSQTYKLLNFLTLLYRSIKLEYLMMRNSSPGLQVLEIEDHILNGIAYWSKLEKSAASQVTNISERVIS